MIKEIIFLYGGHVLLLLIYKNLLFNKINLKGSGFELIIDIISNPPNGTSLSYLNDDNRSENVTLINTKNSYIF